MTKGENAEYFYLQYKFANKNELSEKDKLRLDELQKKYIEESQNAGVVETTTLRNSNTF